MNQKKKFGQGSLNVKAKNQTDSLIGGTVNNRTLSKSMIQDQRPAENNSNTSSILSSQPLMNSLEATMLSSFAFQAQNQNYANVPTYQNVN